LEITKSYAWAIVFNVTKKMKNCKEAIVEKIALK
jgi:hypothetical protein